MKNWLPCLIIFFIFLFAGLREGPGYGISWDEGDQNYLGDLTYDYVVDGKQDLFLSGNKEYGSAFELPLAFVKKQMGYTDEKDVYTLRHQATHIVFLLSGLAIFFLAFRLSRSRMIATGTMLVYLLSPRIYAHSFFNTKDIPFLCFLSVTLLVAHIAFDKDKWWWYVLLGCVSGYTTGIRVLGVLVFMLVCLMFVMDVLHARKDKKLLKQKIANAILYALTYLFSVYASWPYLWQDPVNRFVNSYVTMSHYQWGSKVLTNGRFYMANELPWWYVPNWFVITIPVVWLGAGVAGMIWLLRDALFNPRQFAVNGMERNFLFYLLCLVCPVGAVIGLHSVIYDDWRHLYFIYAPFSLLALYFFIKIGKTKWRYAAAILVCVQLGFTGYFLVKQRHMGQVYFNELVPHEKEYLRKNYELDYWGLSYRQALEYIARTDTAATIRVSSNCKTPVVINQLILDVKDRRHFVYVPAAQADYFLTNFRWHPEEYTEEELPGMQIIYNQQVNNNSVMRVYRLKK